MDIKELYELKETKPELKLIYSSNIMKNDANFGLNISGTKRIPIINASLVYGYTFGDVFITSDNVYPLVLTEMLDNNKDAVSIVSQILSIQDSLKEYEKQVENKAADINNEKCIKE